MRKNILKIVAAIAFLVVPGSDTAAAPPNGGTISLVVSHEGEPFSLVLEGFKAYLAREGVTARLKIYPLHGNPENAKRIAGALREEEADLILALGSLALDEISREIRDIPVVAGMVLRSEDIRNCPNTTGVFLEFPPDTQLMWMHRLLPEAFKIGVLFNPSENGNRVNAAESAASRNGLRIVARQVSDPRDLPSALESLGNSVDLLWGISDKVVLNPQTAKNILLFSFRNRIPFFGLSSAWVKAGAYASLDRDYRDIGAQCGELAIKVLQGEKAASLPPLPPRKVTYSLNLKTARQMKIELSRALIEGAVEIF